MLSHRLDECPAFVGAGWVTPSPPAATQIPKQLTWLVEALQTLDLNSMSPVEALTKLYELQMRLLDFKP